MKQIIARARRQSAFARKLFSWLIGSKLEEIPFIVFVSFLLTFAFTRAYVYLTRNDILTFPFFVENIQIHGVHVHHLNWGIFILSIVGFIALYDLEPELHRRLAIVYGIGLGLTFDEFALWLRLQDDYYAQLSYDAIIVIAVILLNIIYFEPFWIRMGGRIRHWLSRVLHLFRA